MTYMEQYRKWLESPALSESERAELEGIGEEEIRERFFAPLEFGTGGLRGVLETGLRRMNAHTVRWTTQAFANLILEEGGGAAARGVAIAYDCRHYSAEFAKETASVLAANGINVKLFDDIRPTPELSFAVREYGCAAGINITASHNPKEYNGYKVYWSDGAQLPPHHAEKISDEMSATDIFTGVKTMPFDEALAAGRVEMLGEAADRRFLDLCLCQSVSRDSVMPQIRALKLVYTPFHGAGYKLIPRALRELGFENVLCVGEQMIPDGDFPTVASPNPEEPDGFKIAVELARANGASLIIGSDPDADRVGVMVRDQHGDGYQVLSGNQTGVLLLDYLIRARKEAGTMPKHPVAIKSIVSTNMASAVAEAHGVKMYETFTGFKFMAELLGKLPGNERYLMAFEESFGYLAGDHARDKDAVTAAILIAEMAAWHAKRGVTLRGALDELYAVYGHYKEKTLNIVMPGADGLERMNELMMKWRGDPPASMGGINVIAVRDYLVGERYCSRAGDIRKLDIKGSSVLYFELEDGTVFIVRPSGTEPKMKIYILTKGRTNAECDSKIEHYQTYARMMVR
ncbi:MAG: phospho-sugar mutase [Oscillospiraceae bacterium]|nr:phospho-sugar mutase [Oscillospiraceae bacterium]